MVLVSHDRHMLELTADRLVLVDGGRAEEFGGTLDDYTDFVLGKSGAGAAAPAKTDRKADRRAAAAAREQGKALRAAVSAAEKEMEALTAQRSRIERAMFDPGSAGPEERDCTMSELMVRRAEIENKLAETEERWLEASQALETVNA